MSDQADAWFPRPSTPPATRRQKDDTHHQEERSVQESFWTLSLDSQWIVNAAQKLIADGSLLEKIIACADLKGVKYKHDDAQGVIFMAAAALVAGKELRTAAIRTLETKTSPPYVLLLEPVANVEVQPTALARELALGYPGTKLVPGSSRKMGADGKMPEAHERWKPLWLASAWARYTRTWVWRSSDVHWLEEECIGNTYRSTI